MSEETTRVEKIHFRVPRKYPQPKRLDRYLCGRYPQHSRALFQKLIRSGAVLVNGRRSKPSYIVQEDDLIDIELPAVETDVIRPEPIPLDILFEDENIIVLNKPAGIVVHPARGHMTGTIANALRYHTRELSTMGGLYKPGIVHRLDKDTTGVLLAAKNDAAHRHLSRQFEKRRVEKEYLAVVRGDLEFDSDVIDRPLGRHTHDRTRMAVRQDGRQSESFYEVIERFGGYSYVRIAPKTGRTHQVRVHLTSLGHPVVGDREYRGPVPTWRSLGVEPENPTDDPDSPVIARQALHARRIRFFYPLTDRRMEFTAALPEDFERLLRALRRTVERKGSE
jgi:23S rRNA pseudouridine1911/1915/1917 synthase